MMKHRLYIVEGLPCSGKSTISAYIASFLAQEGKVCFVDEGTGEHPADYEYHAYAPAGLLSESEQVVSLADCSDEMRERLLPYKIYDGLPWEIERPVMLEKWRQFAGSAQQDTQYVFNCVFLQNPMCETMMRFDFPEAASKQYIEEIAEIISPLNPLILYLKNDDIQTAVCSASLRRSGWLDAVIDYHVHGAYGMRIGARGFDGYIRCLKERQERELRILSQLPVAHIIVDNPQRNWHEAEKTIREKIQGTCKNGV